MGCSLIVNPNKPSFRGEESGRAARFGATHFLGRNDGASGLPYQTDHCEHQIAKLVVKRILNFKEGMILRLLFGHFAGNFRHETRSKIGQDAIDDAGDIGHVSDMVGLGSSGVVSRSSDFRSGRQLR
jgi:hypothetical protein